MPRESSLGLPWLVLVVETGDFNVLPFPLDARGVTNHLQPQIGLSMDLNTERALLAFAEKEGIATDSLDVLQSFLQQFPGYE